jgi:DNA replication factor GINS
VTLEEIFSIRSSKIVSLAQSHADGSFIDREELKLLHPGELSMFHRVVEAIRECRSVLIEHKVTAPPSTLPSTMSSTSQSFSPYAPSTPDILPATIHLEGTVSSSPLTECGTVDRFNTSESLNAGDSREDMHFTSPTFDTKLQDQEPLSVSGLSEMEMDECVIFEGKENIDCFSDTKAYSLVLVVTDMEPFMGVDGYVYEIRSGDIITLPRKNADVLTERNIVLNIKSS